MRRMLFSPGCIGLVCLCLFGCSGDGVAPRGDGNHDNPNPVSPSQVDERLVAANTRFGFQLFSQLIADGAGENVFISAPSIALALSMTLNGASGETYEGMVQVLELEGLSLEEINEASATWIAWLKQADPKVTLTIANSLWANQGYAFYSDFVGRNETYYGAQTTTLDFRKPEAAATINAWVDAATQGKIDGIVNRIPPEAILYLINAIYFKGLWQTPFEEAQTWDAPFHLLDGTEKMHPAMHQKGWFPYLRGEDFQAVSLPYGEDGRMGMYVFLPDKDANLDEFLEGLDAEQWEAWMSRFQEKEGNLALPRFEIEYEAGLNEPLIALGMGPAFDPGGADFSAMLPVGPLANAYISRVKHKTYVKVNEEGTEAAAATSVEVGVTSIPDIFWMTVDRPFFCAIRDNATGTVLFMGAIVEPE